MNPLTTHSKVSLAYISDRHIITKSWENKIAGYILLLILPVAVSKILKPTEILYPHFDTHN